jgi:hypothetical protein
MIASFDPLVIGTWNTNRPFAIKCRIFSTIRRAYRRDARFRGWRNRDRNSIQRRGEYSQGKRMVNLAKQNLVNGLALSSSIALLGGLLIQPPCMAQTPQRQKIDVSKLGPKVGDRIPDFSLPDQNGKTQTLRSIMGPKGAILVFIRSANW